jgi:heme A synthase
MSLIIGILGGWLVVSGFLWPHTTAQRVSTSLVGILAIVFAGVSAYSKPNARYVNAALAVWLFFSTFALPAISKLGAWNDLFVSVLMLACALAPPKTRPRKTAVRRPAH